MSHPPFHVTRLGRTYYEHQVPELLRQLARLNTNFEAMTAALARTDATSDDRAEPDSEAEEGAAGRQGSP